MSFQIKPVVAVLGRKGAGAGAGSGRRLAFAHGEGDERFCSYVGIESAAAATVAAAGAAARGGSAKLPRYESVPSCRSVASLETHGTMSSAGSHSSVDGHEHDHDIDHDHDHDDDHDHDHDDDRQALRRRRHFYQSSSCLRVASDASQGGSSPRAAATTWTTTSFSHHADGGERPLSVQLAWLSPEERSCFDSLKNRWEDRCKLGDRPGRALSDGMYLRFARCHCFREESAWKALEKFDARYLSLAARGRMEAQLRTKTLFIAPGLRTADGLHVLYMKPARHFPGTTPTRVVVDNLAYCMLSVTEKEHAAANGVAFLANMDGWTMTNFSMSYCYEFMQMLQGRRVPVRVRLFLIVNPPAWFGNVWSKMKPMLSSDFRKRVHMIREDDLSHYLTPDYPLYLPDEMRTGRADTDAMVQGFIAFRQGVERRNRSNNVSGHTHSNDNNGSVGTRGNDNDDSVSQCSLSFNTLHTTSTACSSYSSFSAAIAAKARTEEFPL